MKKNILISVDDFSPQQLELISNSVKDWAAVKSIPQSADENHYRKELNSSNICIGWPSPGWLLESGIKFLQIGSSGWDAYQHKGLENISGFTCCTAKGIYTIGLVEHAMAMMFALVRRIPVHIRDKDQQQFKRHLPYATEITGSTACIVGMGDAGILLAKRLKGLAMKVIAVVRRKEVQFENVDEIILSENLESAVAKADHIFLLVPGIPANENLFNGRIFNACKPTAFFYNLSRGTNVDEESLYQALQNKKIAGAGLDVTRIEPLPAGDKLWKLGDNVLITGHSAGLSSGHTGRFCELVIRNLYNYHHNLPFENKVI